MDRGKRTDMNRLMTELADGNRAAFHPIFVAAWPIVRGFCARFIGDVIEAEDAAQLALVKVFERAPTFREGSEAMTWILTIAAYECRTVRQKTRRRRELGDSTIALSMEKDAAASPERELIEREVRTTAAELFEGLAEVDKQVILTALEKGERPEGVSATAFRKRVQRAMDRLRFAKEKKHGDA